MILVSVMGMSVSEHVWAADYTFGTVLDTESNKHNVVVSPSKDYWRYGISVSGGGLMYYPDEPFSNNNLTLNNTQHSKGLVIATGFYDVSSKPVNPEDVEYETVEKNIAVIKDADVNAKGYFELTGGYMAHWASGILCNNGIIVINSKVSADKSVGLYANLVKSGKGASNNNYVSISDSEILPGTTASIIGGHATKGCDVNNNLVVISGENKKSIIKNASIYGGLSEYGEIPKGEVHENQQSGKSFGNKVNIGIAELTDCNIYGGYSDLNGSAEQNTVTISGNNKQTILKDTFICAGWSGSGSAIKNTLNVSNADLNGSSLYGGYSANGGIVSGNTLNVGENISGKLDVISGFNAINFENIKWENGGTVLEAAALELTGNAETKSAGLENKGTEVIIKKISGDVKLNDYMNLIASDEKIAGKLANAGEQSVEVGVAQIVKVATGNLEKESNAIKFTIVGAELNPQVKAIGEAGAVANGFVANGTGLVEDSINAMMCEERIGYKTFAQVHGSNLDFDTDNNLSVKGWNGIVGVGETTEDRLTYGVFFETGEGDYNTLAKQSEGYIRGDGEVDYNGGGLLVRKDFDNGIYTEASLRAGRMSNELRDAVVDSSNKLSGFDISSTYYGAHIGIGKIIPRGEKESLDIYGKFLYSHHYGYSFVIDGDTFNMDSVNSQRLRVGFRYNELNGSKLRMYYGAAYEYEFDGDANNTVLDYNFSSPDLGGSTVIGELGLHYNADAKWCFDVNLRGYGGKREGVSGSVQANYMF